MNGEDTRLFDLFTVKKHTVLVYAPSGKERGALEAAEALSGIPEAQTFLIVREDPTKLGLKTQVPVLFDRHGHGHEDYLVEEDAGDIVIVRPDSFVGAVVKDLEAAKRYFAKIMII